MPHHSMGKTFGNLNITTMWLTPEDLDNIIILNMRSLDPTVQFSILLYVYVYKVLKLNSRI